VSDGFVTDGFRLNMVELRRRLGTRRTIAMEGSLAELVVGSTFVPEDRMVRVEAEIESVSNGVVVAGRVLAPWTGECRRCLDPVEGVLDLPVRELVAEAGDPDELYLLDGDDLDLTAMVHDLVLLHLPLAPLCRPDCLGPDPTRYPAHVASGEPAGDPRWAALSELRLED
jgi:uncharacterized protein